MKKDNSFHEYVMHDLLGDISGITSGAMFGGWGIYKDGIIFAIITDGELYFKVDDSNKANYKEFGSHPFSYTRGNKKIELSYWLLPEDIMENREELYKWVQASANINKNSA